MDRCALARKAGLTSYLSASPAFLTDNFAGHARACYVPGGWPPQPGRTARPGEV